jgi:DNA polymerase III subunit delta
MPEQSYAQVMAALRSKSATAAQLSTVYLLTGSDDSLKREVLGRLQDLALDPDFADFDRETIDLGPGSNIPDGESDPALRILGASGMAPFMSPRRVVLVSSVQRLPKERQVALADGVKQLGAISLLVLVADAPEWEAGRPKGRQLEAVFKKSVATFGTVVNCDSPQAADLRHRAEDLLKGWGKHAESRVLDALSEHAAAVSANAGSGAVGTLTRECEKLRAYVGERDEIVLADADALMPDVAQENIFRLLDAVGSRNSRQAMEYVEAMLAVGDRPDGAVARAIVMLQRHMRMLMLAKYAVENRLTGRGSVPDEVKDILTTELMSTLTGQAYRMPNYIKQAAKFSWPDLVWSSSRILASDLALKGIVIPDSLGASSPVPGDDPSANFRLLVAQLCAGIK